MPHATRVRPLLPWMTQTDQVTCLRLSTTSFLVITMALATLAHTATSCSPECACYHVDDGQVVSCRHQNMDSVPKDLPEDTIELDMGYNYLPKLDKNTFPPLPNLQRLILDRSQVERIEEDAFTHLINLQYLKLSHNSISDVHSKAFQGLLSLRKLHLDNNQIKNLSHALFRELTLEELLLHSNDIQTLDDKTFEGSSIVNLNLDENNISNISMELFTPLKSSLKNFNLSHNEQPLKIGVDVFAGFNFSDLKLSYDGLKDPAFLKSIQAHSLDISGHPFPSLDFSDCENFRTIGEFYLRNLHIEELNESILVNLLSVTLLDLSENQLVTIDGEIFRHTPKLRVLRLDSNLFISLPENLGTHLSNLEVLKVPQNKLAMVRPDAFHGMNRLTELDMRNNHIQVIEESMKDILTGLETVLFEANPLHCNCEMRWYRLWLNETGKDTGAFECFSPAPSSIFSLTPDEFKCRPPQVKYVTPNMNAMEGESVYLTCSAEGDPAPEVQWTSPFGEIVSVTPPFNRTRYVTYAIWHVSRMKSYQAGWFVCKASNRKGTHQRSMYIHVYPQGGSTIDVDSLTMSTTTPLPTTTTSTTIPTTTTTIPTTTTTYETTTTTRSTSTAASTTTTASTTVSTTTPYVTTTTMPTTTTEVSTTEKSTTPPPTTTLYTTLKKHDSGEDDQFGSGLEPWMFAVIIGCTLGTILIVTFVGVCIYNGIKKKHRHGSYDVTETIEAPLAVHPNDANHNLK